MKGLQDFIIEAINEAKVPSPEIQSIIDLFEEIKLNKNLKVTYNVSGSGKSIAGKFTANKQFNEGFVLELENGMSFERGNLILYSPKLKLVKDNVHIYYENWLTSINSSWAPTFPAKKKRSDFIIATEDYDKIVEAAKNIEPNMSKLEKIIENIIKNYDRYTKEAEENAADRMSMSHNEFLKKFKTGTDAYRTAVNVKEVISEVINKDCKNVINNLL